MNRVEKIKAEIDRLQSSTLDENINFKSQYDQGIFDGLSLIDNFIDSLKEPVKRTPAEIEAAMQEIEEKSKLFTEAHKDDVVSNDPISNPLEISRHGNSHIGETLEKAAGNYAFTMSGEDEVLKYYAFIAGAQWQKERDQSTIELAEDHAYLAGQEKIINKACEWLEEQLLNFWSQKITNTDYFIEDFKQAMEE